MTRATDPSGVRLPTRDGVRHGTPWQRRGPGARRAQPSEYPLRLTSKARPMSGTGNWPPCVVMAADLLLTATLSQSTPP